MNVVILQPSYIPWRGYFHQIAKADVFIFYDDVQYDKRGWRNRNRIKTPDGVKWLTIPVHSRGAQIENIPIHHIQICNDRPWKKDHWRTIEFAYGKAPYYAWVKDYLEAMYCREDVFLADFAIQTTMNCARLLGLEKTEFLRSSALTGVSGVKTDRLLSILKTVGATHYISGPSARNYLEEEKFGLAGITLEFMDYHYPKYEQLYPPYDPQVSILDLMVMEGPRTLEFILP